MTRNLLLSAAFAAFGMGACAPGMIGADVTRDLAEQTIPGDPAAHAAAVALGQAGGYQAPVMSFASDSAAVDTSGLNHILLRSVTLSITSTAEPAGDTDCWDFVQNVSVYMSSNRQGSTLPRVLIAQGASPGCVREMQLTPGDDDVNLKPYTDEGFHLEVEASGIPPQDDVSFSSRLLLRAAVF